MRRFFYIAGVVCAVSIGMLQGPGVADSSTSGGEDELPDCTGFLNSGLTCDGVVPDCKTDKYDTFTGSPKVNCAVTYASKYVCGEVDCYDCDELDDLCTKQDRWKDTPCNPPE